jgi:hypothetical protein
MRGAKTLKDAREGNTAATEAANTDSQVYRLSAPKPTG